MANPFDRPGGPPPDFAVPEADALAEVIPLRPRGSAPRRPGADAPHPGHTARRRAAGHVPSGPSRHPAGRKRQPAVPQSAEENHEPDQEPDPRDVARAIVLKQLAGAPRTRRQLADKLAQRGCEPQVAREVLDRLQEVGLVNDRDFAETYVRSRQESRGLGRRALAGELRHKGVADDVVREVLEGMDADQEREQARALVAKKLRTLHGLEAQVQARRLAGMLARKGYAAPLAWSVIREAITDSPDSPTRDWYPHQPD